ncbi:aminoglycoside N3-acetyltransferase [Listeria fleischmannii 1991]|uniref:Aminoglycoside N(3)-acetyltransferase n=2 Tax=Listeria fleischmannii TaxID=1069827 RepID=A0A2X3G2N5_9LIST|nr:AAC(3) family N-acetyltransferase [Listeria fleischmannii]KMT58091.1 aminoglycoside N3-acetyltransferase [Listeria fleischmannii 1991]SQC62168.1 SPBc2 prophage-derived aminoglycoside N(3 ')-acetyltransferase-like protein yokD [Listeria fleischmannii subsp. fleischmannii]
MGEKLTIWRTEKPYTKSRLINELKKAGLKEGDTIIFHASMSQAGWICGGAITVIDALQSVVTKNGTIVMPAQTGGLTDPENWENPPVPKAWWEEIRATMPIFDKERTPSYKMGVIAETFRALPDVCRSNHPFYSFTAWGKKAEEILQDHSLEHGFGENSPLGKLYQIKDSQIVLFGVDNDSNTSLHLAEERSTKVKNKLGKAALLKDGKRVIQTFEEKEYNSELFLKIGETFEQEKGNHKKEIALAPSKIFNLKEIIDFAENYLNTNET